MAAAGGAPSAGACTATHPIRRDTPARPAACMDSFCRIQNLFDLALSGHCSLRKRGDTRALEKHAGHSKQCCGRRQSRGRLTHGAAELVRGLQ